MPTPFQLFTMWSFRKELIALGGAFLILLSLPVIAVVILTNAGINIVSDKLATSDAQTGLVELHDPLTGDVTQEVHGVMRWPVAGVITLEFGVSDLPYQPAHTGIDIANSHHQVGDPITPFMDGTVIYAGEIFWGYGKHIIIDHGSTISSLYAHLDKIYVFKGQKVHLGEVIGTEGQTGWATGPHLHFQIDVKGIPVNPRTFLKAF